MLTWLLMRNAVDGLTARVSVMGSLVATEPRAHLVMHVDVPHVLMQSAVDRLATREPIVSVLVALSALARLTHGPGPGRGGRAVVRSRVGVSRLTMLATLGRVPIPIWRGP